MTQEILHSSADLATNGDKKVNLHMTVMTRNSQRSSSHQRLHIADVNLQGFVVLVHGFDVAAMFEVVNTCTNAADAS